MRRGRRALPVLRAACEWGGGGGTGPGRAALSPLPPQCHRVPTSRRPWRSRRVTAAARWSSTGAAWPPRRPPGRATVTACASTCPAAPPLSECGTGAGEGAVLPARSGWRELSARRCPRSPIVRRIRQDCAEPFAAFERCLRENEAAVLNCSEQVDAFLLCADRVKLST